ncbi:MAG: hypothetical protein ACLGH0_04935, partial [Thermoanaerobaculia bacterium]
MTPRRIGIAVAFALVVALLWSRQRYEPLSYYSSRSYVQRANSLIRKGALQFDCRDNVIKLMPSATAAERKWFEESYLEDDVELYNRNRELFGHFFVVQDCQLRELNPFLRTVRLPFAETIEWRGNIAYSGPGTDAALLSSNGRTINLTKLPPTADRQPPTAELRTQVGNKLDVSANVVHLDFSEGAMSPGIEIHNVAGTVVLEQRVKNRGAAEVRLLGNAVPEGRIARLASGDWLYLAAKEPKPVSETFLFSAERRFARPL